MKIIYIQKEHSELIKEHLGSMKKWTMMTYQQQENTMLEIWNKYGEEGWIVNPNPYRTSPSGSFLYLFRKEVHEK